MKIDTSQFLIRPEYQLVPGQLTSQSQYPSRVDIFATKKFAKTSIKTDAKAIAALSHKLYAQAGPSLLIVLQGMDTSGKDGTTQALFSRAAPLNIRIEAFKAPSKKELAHDYLWRVHNVCPPKGGITVFNRSHYEDVLVVKVRGFAPTDKVEQRYEQINDFERHLAANGTKILKFMLNVSKETQGQRLQERLEEAHKYWKFNPGDLEDRRLWPAFMDAYETMLCRTSTQYAPWYVIPSDHRSTRNAIICRVVRETLEAMNPEYPTQVYKSGDFEIG